jgi:hypothetical protein
MPIDSGHFHIYETPVGRNTAHRAIKRETEVRRLLTTIAIVVALAGAAASIASAATSCTTRKSGSVSITSCSNTYRGGGFSECRSYASGRTIKTSCR